MNTTSPALPRVERLSALTLRQVQAFELLRDAFEAAQGEFRDAWQFAVEIAQLRAAGLSHTDLRRLLCAGYLQHARECTRSVDGERTFRRLATLALPKDTCFVLTSKGQELLSSHDQKRIPGSAALTFPPPDLRCSLAGLPRWDGESRQLWCRGYLVKQFRRAAVNQELVLAALEEEGWPVRIDDPLPQTPGIDPKVRLHDTIKTLNRNCHYNVISFRGDGSGRGVGWVVANPGCRSHRDLP